MRILNWFTGQSKNDDTIIVKTLKSKGVGKYPIPITVKDIQSGYATDASGYRNEVVLFLRKNKSDR